MLVVPTRTPIFINTVRISRSSRSVASARWRTVAASRFAATNGMTAIPGPDGVPHAEAPPQTKAALVATVPLREDVTTAFRIGRWLGYLTIMADVSDLVVATCRPCRRGAATRFYYRA